MRQALALAALLLTGCTLHLPHLPFQKPAPPPPLPAPDMSGVLSVSGRSLLAHVCPISPTLALTAEHVSGWHSMIDYWGRAYTVALLLDLDGRPVTLMEVNSDMRRDLSVVEIVLPEGTTFSKWYDIAKEVPEVGDPLWLMGYDEPAAWAQETVAVTYRGSVAGRMLYDLSGGPGSSGSCILNAAGEVVGINTHSTGVVGVRGVGQLVAGPWANIATQDSLLP